MKILQLGKFYPIHGGVEKVAYDLMTGLSERNIPCDMLCAVSQGKSRIIPVNKCARVIGCHTWLKAASTMISPTMDPMACLSLYLSGYKGKVILHWHSDIQRQKFLLKLYRPLLRWLLRRADWIIGTTPVYLSESPHLQGFQHKTICLPIGVEPMCPDSEAVASIKRSFPGRKIVFSLGRLVPYKGYKYLIAAAQYLKDDFVILIGGMGELKEELQKEINELRLQHKVKLLGRISDEDLPAYYGACDVFCLSSIQKTEAFGIVQIEAMSCGKPVVATRIPQSGVAWVNAHGVSGLNVMPGNAIELAQAIEAITENKDTYARYSAGAKERYHELFTKKRMIEKCLNIYCHEK